MHHLIIGVCLIVSGVVSQIERPPQLIFPSQLPDKKSQGISCSIDRRAIQTLKCICDVHKNSIVRIYQIYTFKWLNSYSGHFARKIFDPFNGLKVKLHS
jgi:hypothetical protein